MAEKTVWKMRVQRYPERRHQVVQWFVGKDRDHLQNAGQTTLSQEEVDLLAMTLQAGAPVTGLDFVIEVVGEPPVQPRWLVVEQSPTTGRHPMAMFDTKAEAQQYVADIDPAARLVLVVEATA